MADAPLATPADALEYNTNVSEASLRRASTRARQFTGQHISAATYTVTARGPRVQLPQRPARKVLAVTTEAGSPVSFKLNPGGVLELGHTGTVSITYEAGHTVIPDTIVETIVTIAARLEAINPALAVGVTQESSDGESVSLGGDAWRGVGGLVGEEKDALRRAFPKRPALIVLRP